MAKPSSVPRQPLIKLESLDFSTLQLARDSLEPPKSPGTWSWLAEHPEDAAELASLLNEAAPTLGTFGLQHAHPYPRLTPPRTPVDVSRWPARTSTFAKERLRTATPIPIDPGQIDWTKLSAYLTSEMLVLEEPELGTPDPSHSDMARFFMPMTPGGSLVEVNSGGRVMFCLFAPADGEAHEGCLVVKFVPSRLLCQSELFANELAQHVGICAPNSRILRAASSDGEWGKALAAAENICEAFPDLYEEMTATGSLLLMEYVPGRGLFSSPQAFLPDSISRQTFEDLGRLFALDMLLGNSDRLRCEALGWRGNSENVMWSSASNRLVAIDAMVQRRPPGGLLSAEDAACERLVELALNDSTVAEELLLEAVGASPAAAVAAVSAPAVAAFETGMRRGLGAMHGLKGLLEMMFDVVTEWISEFIDDIEETYTPPVPPTSGRRATSAGATPSQGGMASSAAGGSAASTLQSPTDTTFKIRRINHEAAHNRSVSEKVSHWKALFRARGEDLRAAVEEWQAKRHGCGDGSAGGGSSAGGNGRLSEDSNELPIARLTTGFLDGTHPIVDVYELKVRLEHMLQRLRVLQQATATAKPTPLLPNLFLSGAVEASSLHLLKHYGITHVLNATEDLLLPEETHAFVGMRIPLRDADDEDIYPFFDPSASFIDSALEAGGGVLVHCHAGRSRSCSLVLAWLMTRRRWTLREALDFLHQHRPQAAPNAGYLQQLAKLEAELFGTQTVKVKRTKPEPKLCPECGDKVGLSAESVRVHLRLKHPGRAHAHLAAAGGK